jgi:hypothetical protein
LLSLIKKQTTLKNTLTLNILRIAALIVLLAGAWESLHYVLQADQNSDSSLPNWLLIAWVLLPFAALLTADIVSGKWGTKTRLTTYVLMLLISVGSFMAYSGMFGPQGTNPTTAFGLVPLASLLLLMIVIPLSAFLARKEE